MATMKNARQRVRTRAMVTVLVGVALVMATFGTGVASAGDDQKSLTIGSKDVLAAQVLGQIYGQVLESKGYDITYQENLGPTEVVFAALENGDIDLYPEYLNTVVQFLGGTGGSEVTAVKEELDGLLADRGTVATTPAPAVDVNGFYVTKATAKQYKLKKVSDLKKVDDQLVFGGPPECEERDLCLGPTSQDLYGLQFKSVEKLDVGGPITVTALEDGDIDVALLFTGSSVIPKGAVLLKDDKGLQGADNPLVLVRENKDTKALNKILNNVSKKITTKAYNQFTEAVNVDLEDPADAASAFIDANNLT
jgi:osmoprotectant transport system substrate-binding protein